MVEKKQVVHALRLHYTGPFSIEEFFAEVEDFISDNGMHKELKRKSEELQKKGKKADWIIEAWRQFDADAKGVVLLHATFDNLKERKIKRNKLNTKVQYSDIYVEISGFVTTSITGRWTQAPLYTFFKTLFDKYIWIIEGKEDGIVSNDCYDLHKRIKAFFELYKLRVG